jgi:Transposase DDE domain group 1
MILGRPSPRSGGHGQPRARLRACAEDRIRTLKDTDLMNLPLQAFAKNEIWLELAALAYELLTWTQLLDWPTSRTQLGTQTITPATAQRGRPDHHHRPPLHPAGEPTLAMVRPADQRSANLAALN